MKRPTIPDLAKAAGVSVSTVNRVLGAPDAVRESTRHRVLDAAERIGFYGLKSLEYSVRSARPTHRLGVLLQQQNRRFYAELGAALRAAAERVPDANIELVLEFMDDLSPDQVAARVKAVGPRCESLAVIAAEHPLVSEAIDLVAAAGVPVTALIGQLSARAPVGFVGLDNYKVGRTAAWAFDRMCRTRGDIGILVGNHRYRNQELNESGFRSYFREHGAGFTLLEPRSTFETAAVAREMTEQLLRQNRNLCGLFISGGGISGAISALREVGTPPGFVAVGYELFDLTRSALLDGVLTMVISHPMVAFADAAIAALVRAKLAGPEGGAQQVVLPFEISTPENL